MRLLLACLFILCPTAVWAQAVVTSHGPDSASVTVYRDPDRGEGGINPQFPSGFALISETRSIALPAGESVIRFEGVADGMIAVSAVVSGLPGGVAQKNRDARLLSPAALLDGSLGNRVHLRRTSRATGKVVEQDAVIRSGPDGAVVLQTEEGVEALRCSGIPETLSYDSVPDGLSARPTLSVTTVSPSAMRATVTLTYLATGFDWGANYVAKVAPDGRTLDLFAWLTVANGNDASFSRAQLLAVAGRLNKQSDYDALVERAPSPFLSLQCWPMATTSTDSPPPMPAPPPAPMMEAAYDIVVTAQKRTESLAAAPVAMMAKQEELGDLKLYRVPQRVDVNAKGQKQVALLQKTGVPFQLYYAASLWPLNGEGESQPMTRMLRMQNRARDGLGIPLPAGGVALFEQTKGESLLLADGGMRDHAVGEETEINGGESPQVQIIQTPLPGRGKVQIYRIEISNALDRPAPAEVKIAKPDGEALVGSSRKLGEKDGAWLWTVTVPANGKAQLTYELKEPD
ncbi:DUF4139 domain-containing protein [Sphingobium phenoxybenzoativorans]|uniref:DUF4139 domain-containing protein n=1 Tax=Sphingobium phenoxybenzoativorans TaxID=1592790 RepID=UPI000872DB31|nr:hypothetical protein [Sphingobium phenoxybenzoativorans]